MPWPARQGRWEPGSRHSPPGSLGGLAGAARWRRRGDPRACRRNLAPRCQPWRGNRSPGPCRGASVPHRARAGRNRTAGAAAARSQRSARRRASAGDRGSARARSHAPWTAAPGRGSRGSAAPRRDSPAPRRADLARTGGEVPCEPIGRRARPPLRSGVVPPARAQDAPCRRRRGDGPGAGRCRSQPAQELLGRAQGLVEPARVHAEKGLAVEDRGEPIPPAEPLRELARLVEGLTGLRCGVPLGRDQRAAERAFGPRVRAPQFREWPGRPLGPRCRRRTRPLLPPSPNARRPGRRHGATKPPPYRARRLS